MLTITVPTVSQMTQPGELTSDRVNDLFHEDDLTFPLNDVDKANS